MNIQTIITIIFCSACGLVCVVMLTYGFIKSTRIKRQRYKKFGYHTMTNRQQVNTLKSKVRESVRLGYIPSVFEDLYNEISIDTKVSYCKYLNKLVKKYRKKRGYYKKHVQEDMNLRTFIKGVVKK